MFKVLTKLAFSNCIKLSKCNAIIVQTNRHITSNRNNLCARSYGFAENKSKQNVASYGWVLLIIPATTFGLGCWQIYRKDWKENLIKEMEKQSNSEPVDVPDNLTDLDKMEYRPVKLIGEFIHEREIYMGPRSILTNNESTTQGGLMSTQDKGLGYLVITPFKLDGRNDIILVNRGWVPKNKLDPRTRQSGQISGTVELVGVMRKGEGRAPFMPENKGRIFIYKDLNKMCAATDALPFFIDARIESTIPNGPIGGQTRISLRNEHLSYIVTWFSLSAFTSFLWYRQIYKRLPPL